MFGLLAFLSYPTRSLLEFYKKFMWSLNDGDEGDGTTFEFSISFLFAFILGSVVPLSYLPIDLLSSYWLLPPLSSEL